MTPNPTPINSIRDLAAAVRGRRLGLDLSQAELAARANVSRQWLSQLEAGKPTAELGLVLALLDALGLRLGVEAVDAAARPPGSVDLDALLEEHRER